MKKKLLTIFLVTIIASIGLGSATSYAFKLPEEGSIPMADEGWEQDSDNMESMGLDPNDGGDQALYSEYKAENLNYKETTDAKEADLSAKDAVEGKAQGLSAEETSAGTKAGLTPAQTAEASSENISNEDAAEGIDAGLSIEDTAKAKEAELTLDEAVAGKEANLSVEDTAKAKEAKLPFDEAAEGIEAGLSVEETNEGIKAGLSIEETAEGNDAGLSVEQTAKAKAEKMDPKDYKAMVDKNLDPSDEAARQTYMNEKEAAEDQARIDSEHLSLKNMTFNVGEILNTEGSAKQDYFETKNPIVTFILRVIDFATNIMGSIAIIILIVAGFMFMFAQGNQQQLDEAKEVVKYALIGLALTFFSYIITIFIQSMFIS